MEMVSSEQEPNRPSESIMAAIWYVEQEHFSDSADWPN